MVHCWQPPSQKKYVCIYTYMHSRPRPWTCVQLWSRQNKYCGSTKAAGIAPKKALSPRFRFLGTDILQSCQDRTQVSWPAAVSHIPPFCSSESQDVTAFLLRYSIAQCSLPPKKCFNHALMDQQRCIYMQYIYIYIHFITSRFTCIYIYIFMCFCIYIYVCVYVDWHIDWDVG